MTVTDQEIHAAVEGQTVPSAFVRTIRDHGSLVALREKVGDGWAETTYAEYGDQVARVAAGLAALGVGDGTRVVVMMRNIPRFHVVDMAAYFCGATPISIYNSSSPEQVAYLTGHKEFFGLGLQVDAREVDVHLGIGLLTEPQRADLARPVAQPLRHDLHLGARDGRRDGAVV
mgnify:CR=1 FL=1